MGFSFSLIGKAGTYVYVEGSILILIFGFLHLLKAHDFPFSPLYSSTGRNRSCFQGISITADHLLHMATLGGKHDSLSSSSQNSAEIDGLARFAVDEHNKKENALLEFARVIKAQEQVVAGTLHHLTLEVVDAGKKKLYEAKVWVKPWMNFKELQEFKHVEDVPNFTPSDLGVKKDDHGPGLRSVPVHDPVVQDAANHAVKTIQQRSNSLFPYELHEIINASAEVTDESAKINMHLKLKRGDKEEKFKVEVHKDSQGTFKLNQMVPDQS